jgi:hypothetical protein
LFRFGNLGSFCQTRDAGASRTGRGFSTERRIVIHYYFHCFSLIFARAGTPGGARKSMRHKAKFAARSNAGIVFHCY